MRSFSPLSLSFNYDGVILELPPTGKFVSSFLMILIVAIGTALVSLYNIRNPIVFEHVIVYMKRRHKSRRVNHLCVFTLRVDYLEKTCILQTWNRFELAKSTTSTLPLIHFATILKMVGRFKLHSIQAEFVICEVIQFE